jgi:hypothetical protein
MNIQKMGAEHSIDTDLLPENPVILDVGCRGYEFDNEILAIRPNARIYAVDPDPEIDAPDDPRIFFFRIAITELPDASVKWQGPGEGAYICDVPSGYGWGGNSPVVVHNSTLPALMKQIKCEHFDVVKLDCESSEFGILENWPGKIATQISCEFHDCMNREKWNDAYFEKLFRGPLKDYNVALFGLTPLGPGNTLSHWDSLFILK